MPSSMMSDSCWKKTLINGGRIILSCCYGILYDRLGRRYIILMIIVAVCADFGRGVSRLCLDKFLEFGDTD